MCEKHTAASHEELTPRITTAVNAELVSLARADSAWRVQRLEEDFRVDASTQLIINCSALDVTGKVLQRHGGAVRQSCSTER